MSVNEPLQAVVLQDENGNLVGVVLDGSVYRIQGINKVLNASGSQINPATQETLASLEGKDFATQTTLSAADTKLGTIDGVLDAIKDTDGVKKITDPLPAGTNLLGKVQLRNPGDTVDLGDATNPVRTDPTGTTTQPVSDAGGSLTVDTPQLPVALVGSRLDTNVGAWMGSTVPTVGQKTMADSVPVAVASDQAEFPVVQGTKGSAANAWPVAAYDASGNLIASATGEPGAADRAYVVRPIEVTRASYYAVFDRIAPAANKYMATLFNTSSTRKVVVQRVLRYSWRKASQAGNYDATPEQYLARITARTAGTAVTIRSDDTGDTISSGISADTNSTAVTEAHIIRRFFAWLEPVDFADAAPGNWQPLAPEKNALVWERKFGTRGLTLRENQGITIRNVTSVTQSDVSYVFEFTDEVA